MTLIGLIIAGYLIIKILQEKEKLEEARARLKRVIYITAADMEQEEEEEEQHKRVWWLFWGR